MTNYLHIDQTQFLDRYKDGDMIFFRESILEAEYKRGEFLRFLPIKEYCWLQMEVKYKGQIVITDFHTSLSEEQLNKISGNCL